LSVYLEEEAILRSLIGTSLSSRVTEMREVSIIETEERQLRNLATASISSVDTNRYALTAKSATKNCCDPPIVDCSAVVRMILLISASPANLARASSESLT
jgi:hypothetical protein